MSNFTGTRVTHRYVQHNPAAPEVVFPLLCPVREQEWVPGWEYRLIYSASGFAELGCCFTTPEPDGSQTTWLCTEYDRPTAGETAAAHRIAFAWLRPGLVACLLSFTLRPDEGGTEMQVGYSYTGLSEAGNAEVARYGAAWFGTKMQRFEAALNQYLRTGKCIDATPWE